MKRALVVTALLAAAAVALTAGGCRSPLPNRVPIGEQFPSAAGKALTGERVEVPAAWFGAPTVVLIGYVQDAQFDADRWMLGLMQAGAKVRIVELPTINSRIASVFEDTIDEGMKGGIPPEDWSSVVTVYGKAARPIAAFTGNERPRNMRVLLLDRDGKVVWFHDEGYSPRELLEMIGVIESLDEAKGA
jgi:hypothetical protein